MLDVKRDDFTSSLAILIDEDDLLPSEVSPLMNESVNLHCTLAYGIPLGVHSLESLAERFLDAVKVSGLAQATLRVKGVTTFDTKDGDCLVLLVESPQITMANSELSDLTKDFKSPFGFNPHVTMAYLKNGRGAKYEKRLKDCVSFSLSPERLIYSTSSDSPVEWSVLF
jgi:2'-5' RNA ligase